MSGVVSDLILDGGSESLLVKISLTVVYGYPEGRIFTRNPNIVIQLIGFVVVGGDCGCGAEACNLETVNIA